MPQMQTWKTGRSLRRFEGLHSLARAALVVGVLGSAALLTGCENDLTEAEYIARAKERVRSGDHQGTAIELKNALRRNPNNAEARWLLGNLYLTVGDGVNAEKELRRAADLKIAPVALAFPLAKAVFLQDAYHKMLDEMPIVDGISRAERSEWLVLRGRAWLALGDKAKAKEEFAKAYREDPQSPQALLGQGLVAFFDGDLANAKVWTAKAITQEPRFSEALTLNGDVLVAEHALEDAVKIYTQAIDSRTMNLLDRVKRAQVLIDLNRLVEAQGDLDRLLKAAPRSPDVKFLQGVLSYRRERLEEAQSALEDALRLRPVFPQASFYLGLTLLARNVPAQAESQLSQAVDRMPGAFEPAYALAALQARRGDLVRAEALLKPFAASQGDDPKLLSLRGDLYLRQGKTDLALRDLGRVADLDPTSAKAQYTYGLALLVAARADEGFAALAKAVELDPKMRSADQAMISSLVRSKDYDKALEIAQRLRQRDPGDIALMNAIGQIQLLRGDMKAARDAFNDATHGAPGDLFSVRSLAGLDVKAGDPESARKRLTAFIERQPGNIEALMSLASLEVNSGKPQAAAEWLRRAVSAAPQALEPRALLSTYLIESGQPEQAVALLKDAALSASQNQPLYLLSLAEAQLATGQAYNAVGPLEQLQQQQPRSPFVSYLLARAYAETKNPEKALTAVRRTLQLEPGHVLASAALTRLLVEQGKVAEAEAVLAEAEKRHPGDRELLAQRGWLESRKGDPKDAVVALSKAFVEVPTASLAIELARAQSRLGESAQAVATLEKWVAAHPDDTVVSSELAELYAASGRTDAAVAVLKKLVDKGNRSPVLLNNLAWLLRSSDPKQGLSYAERAVENAPGAAPIMDTLGVLLLDNGQVPRAIKVLDDALKLSPDHLDIRLHLAQALLRNGEKARARDVISISKSAGPVSDHLRAQVDQLREEIARP